MFDRLPFLLLLTGLLRPAAFPAEPQPAPTAPLPSAATPALAPKLSLVDSVQVDSQGIFLDQVIDAAADLDLPRVQVADAPAFGDVLALDRAAVVAVLQSALPALAGIEWHGPETAQVVRRTRSLEEHELRLLLTEAAQAHLGHDVGELELRLARAWTPLPVPDEPIQVQLLDLPRGGLRPNLLLRFDLLAGEERLGGWQLAVQASLWSDLPVARSTLQRGQRLMEADVVLERVDTLTLRDPLAPEALANEHLELSQHVRAGQPILARAVRARPVIRRGGMVEGLIADGLMIISLKVEALEDAVPDQIIRVRNPRTRREFRAQVQDEQTVLLYP